MLSKILVVAVLCSLPSSVMAQSNYALLSGTITDPQARVVPGATVELISVDTAAVRRVVSNGEGIFEIPGLLPGEYRLTVTAPRFASFQQSVRLEVAQRMTLNAPLQIESSKESLEVVAEHEVLKTADASLGEVVEPKSIRELPLNGRMLIDLALTVPGAHLSHGAQTGNMNPLYWRPGQRSAVSIGGNRPNANYFLLDGVTDTDPSFNTLNFSPAPDSVQEFKVQTGSYAAEMGGAGGGQVNIVTRSGSSHLHGTVYEFLRNGAMDAHSFDSMGNNHLVQNNFGASLGGPINHNTFFFANYEGFRHAMAQTMIDTVPTGMEAGGDFSGSGTTIYDPLTAHPNLNFNPAKPVSPSNPQILRDPFPNNMIPANRLNPVALLFLQKYMSRPNVGMGAQMGAAACGMTMMGSPTVVGAGTDCNNFIDSRNELHINNQATARIDHNFQGGGSLTGSIRWVQRMVLRRKTCPASDPITTIWPRTVASHGPM